MFAPKAVVLFGFSLSVAMAATADTFPTGNIFDLTVGVNSVYQPAIDAITGGIVTNPVGFTSVSDMFDGAKQMCIRDSAGTGNVWGNGWLGRCAVDCVSPWC